MDSVQNKMHGICIKSVPEQNFLCMLYVYHILFVVRVTIRSPRDNQATPSFVAIRNSLYPISWGFIFEFVCVCVCALARLHLYMNITKCAFVSLVILSNGEFSFALSLSFFLVLPFLYISFFCTSNYPYCC